METIAPDRVAGVYRVGDGVHVGVGRHRLVERGVENSYLRRMVQKPLARLDPLDVVRVMERSQIYAVNDLRHHLVGDDHRP